MGKLKVVTTDSSNDQPASLDHSNPYAINAATTRDIYNCSEYERAAHALSFVRRSLDNLPSSAAVPGHGALLRQLDQRCHQLAEQLVNRLRVRLCAMFAEDSSPGECFFEHANREYNQYYHCLILPACSLDGRCFRHCVRAVEILGRGAVVCEAFAETVTVPIAA